MPRSLDPPSISPPSDALVELARQLHLAHGGGAPFPPLLASLTDADAIAPSAGTEGLLELWELPPTDGPLLDTLVGFRAPSRWCAAGVVAGGTTRPLPGAPPDADPDPRFAPNQSVVTVSLWHVGGPTVGFVGPPGAPGPPLLGTPEGSAADVICRVLGLATPPPAQTTAAFVEATWLERLDLAVRMRRGRRLTWCWLADHHPLRGTGPAPPAAELAERTRAYGQEQPWPALRARYRSIEPPAARWSPPVGEVVDLDEWFDAGSLSRWILEHLPATEVVAVKLCRVLPAPMATSLAEALTTVDASPTRPAR